MRTHRGRVMEVRLEPGGEAGARIACPPRAIPAPGQYLLAWDGEILGAPLFSAGAQEEGFLAAPPLPAGWAPGTELALLGPLGRGFRLPAGLRRLALAAAGDTAARLLPLALEALQREAAVTLFGDAPLPPLPASLEAYPLNALREAHGWMDFLAVDLPGEKLPDLRAILELPGEARLPCPGQALVVVPMPCAGVGQCGVCAVPARRSWKLACQEGPVFDLDDLLKTR